MGLGWGLGWGWVGVDGWEAGSRDFILDLNCGQCTPSQLVRCHQTSTNQVMDENTKYKKEHQGGKIVLKRARMVIVVEGQAVAINGEIQKFFI